MNKIINTTELQKRIGQISRDVDKNPYIVVNRGEAKMVLLPYFENCDEDINDYFEDFLMEMNKKNLIQQAKKSERSGLSDLRI